MNNNDIILKADNLYFSYDDEKTHSLNGLSLEIPMKPENCIYGCKWFREINFFPLLYRNPQTKFRELFI